MDVCQADTRSPKSTLAAPDVCTTGERLRDQRGVQEEGAAGGGRSTPAWSAVTTLRRGEPHLTAKPTHQLSLTVPGTNESRRSEQ